MAEMRQVLLNSRWKHGFKESICIENQTTYFHHIESNSAWNNQIQFIAKVLNKIRPMAEMRQVSLNLRSEDGFAESLGIVAKTT